MPACAAAGIITLEADFAGKDRRTSGVEPGRDHTGDPRVSDWNQAVIEEFRANSGRVAGVFGGKPLLLLHHTGARTGIRRVSPLMYQDLNGGYAVFASAAGSDKNPDWFHNLRANPETGTETGTGTVAVRARIANGDEHDRIWAKQKADWPQFADYEEKTSRAVIPVVVLERI